MERGLFVAILEAALVAAKLGVDLVGRLVEREMRVLRFGPRLEDQALGHVEHDVAGERVGRGLAERDVARTARG